MKVFVYRKNGSQKVQEINDVVSVRENKKDCRIIFKHIMTEEKVETAIDTKKYKTVTYQN